MFFWKSVRLLKITWIGNISFRYKKQTKLTVSNSFGSVSARIIFSSKKLFLFFPKNILPAHTQSNIVHKYSCHCDKGYGGKRSQRLEEQIRQHVPKFIRNQFKPQEDLPRR